MTAEAREIAEAVRQALRSDPRVRTTAGPIHVALAGDAVLLAGEVIDMRRRSAPLRRRRGCTA